MSRILLLLLISTLTVFTAHGQWSMVSGVPSQWITVVQTQGDTLLAAGPNRIYRSLNGGPHWDSSATLSPTQDFITDVVLFAGQLYAGTGAEGIFVSADGGASWQPLNQGLNGLGANNISRLAVRGNSLYAGTYGARVFVRSTDPLSPWAAFDAGMALHNIECLVNLNGLLLAGAGGSATLHRNEAGSPVWTETAFDEFNDELSIFIDAIATDNRLLGAGTQGLYRSGDQGFTWEFFDPGVGFIERARFARSGDTVWVALQKVSGLSFLFFTTDEGGTWEPLVLPAGNPILHDVAIFNQRLYAATSNGLWRFDVPTSSPEAPASNDVAWGPVWPNPAAGHTRAILHLEKAAPVQVRLLTVATGKVVWEWAFGNLAAGAHQLDLDLEAVPGGAYALELKAGNTRQAVRLVVIP